MSAKKYKRMQAKCESYRRSGRREINKDIKQKRHLKRIEHFALRKEADKTYKYKPPVNEKERKERAEKNVSKKTKIAQLDSWFGKLDFELNQAKLRAKEIAMKKRNSNKHSKL